MAYATTSSFGKTTLSVEFDPVGDSGTYSTICGLTQWDYTENTNLDETEVPDCDNPDLPLEIQRAVRSVGAQASCSGVWALSSHQAILDWARAGTTLSCKITFGVVTDSGAATDTEVLTGDAYMTNLSYSMQYGQKVTASFDLVFDGLPTATLKGT